MLIRFKINEFFLNESCVILCYTCILQYRIIQSYIGYNYFTFKNFNNLLGYKALHKLEVHDIILRLHADCIKVRQKVRQKCSGSGDLNISNEGYLAT